MRKAGLLGPLIVGAMLLLGTIGHVYPSPLAQRSPTALRQSSPDLVVKVKFKCKHVDGKLVCGKTKSEPKPAPVDQPCPSGMIGKQPNCECPEGFYFAAFVGCVPVIPTAPAPSTGPKTHYCITWAWLPAKGSRLPIGRLDDLHGRARKDLLQLLLQLSVPPSNGRRMHVPLCVGGDNSAQEMSL
jgi:hypothetical protein